MSEANTNRWRGWWVIPLILLLALPGASWAIGRSLQAKLQAYREPLMRGTPWMKVAQRRYSQGVFSSREELDFDFGIGSERQRFTIINELKHGPFAGSLVPSLGRIETTVRLPPKADVAVRKLFGDKTPLRAVTTLGWSGGGHTEVTVPDIDTVLGDSHTHVIWQGFNGQFDFSNKLKHVNAQASAPLLRVESPGGESFVFGGLSLTSSGDQVFGDLYSGKIDMKLDAIHFSGSAANTLDATSVRYIGEAPVQGDFMDLILKVGAEHARMAGQDYGPAHYDISFRHMYGPALAGLTREFQKIADQQAMPTDSFTDQQKAQLLHWLRELLTRQPKLVIDEISAATPQGPFSIRGAAQFADFKGADITDLDAFRTLLPKLDVTADISVPVSWASRGGASTLGGGGPQPSGELDGLVQRGLVARKGALVSTHLEFKQGKLLLNGHPFSE